MTVTLADLPRRQGSKDPQLAALDGQATAKRGRNLLTVASGKGGVGKTWFSISLSHALARAGKRALLFDGDLGLANVDIQLGLLPTRDLAAVIGGQASLKDVVERYSDESKTGFDIIAGRSGSGALGRLRPQLLAELREKLISFGEGYDHVVLDMAAGVDAQVATLADHGGRTLVVVTPDPTSITDAYAFIKLHRQRDPQAEIHVVVNQAGDRFEAQRTYDTIKRAAENFLKFSPPLLGTIRRDRNVTAAIREQRPLLARYPLAPASEDVTAIAARLIG
ncbi:MinD/ParA family protein [Govanella unica]|uniref:MinD/ParA family protein n=1 Tax=Govanella unica TaxID=2975056 RepID=A0A9X3Z6H1_9PROT|nr:MinD/ParA family protein [Govania unica]MDA5193008.1 MinD/ParA family protein [Govania unica]